MKKKEKNIIAYYASEENAYEISRSTGNRRDVLSSIRLDIIDDGVSEAEAENHVKNLSEGLEEDGYAYVEYENAAEYNIIIGVAYHGKTKNITDLLKERRQEIVSMF